MICCLKVWRARRPHRALIRNWNIVEVFRPANKDSIETDAAIEMELFKADPKAKTPQPPEVPARFSYPIAGNA